MIRVVVAEDHELVRKGIRKVVDSADDIRIVGEADNIAETSELVAIHLPDMVILDISLSDADGLDGLLRLRERFPGVPVVVLTMHQEDRFAVQALRAGAAAYVTKSMAAEELVEAVRKVARGGIHVGPHLAELLARDLRSSGPAPSHQALTPREMQVVRLLATGMQSKQVADELSISISSVNTYRARIFRKMRLSSNAALIRYAFENGLVR